jgi:CrcB protein
MERFLWICVAGAAGTGTRYLVAMWAAARFGSTFPYGTWFVNVGGCFVLAFVMQSAAVIAWPPTLRSALTIGFLGGLTTYSSFNYETTQLVQEGAFNLAAVNAMVTWAGCFAAGWLGMLTARQMLGTGG